MTRTTCLPKGWSCSHWMASLTVSVSHDFGSCCIHEHRRTLCRRKYHYLPWKVWQHNFVLQLYGAYLNWQSWSNQSHSQNICLSAGVCSQKFSWILACDGANKNKTLFCRAAFWCGSWSQLTLQRCNSNFQSGEGAKDKQGRGTAAFRASPFWCETWAKIQELPGCDVVAVPKTGTGLSLLPHDLHAWRRNNNIHSCERVRPSHLCFQYLGHLLSGNVPNI